MGLTKAQYQEIFALSNNGMSQRKIAEKMGIPRTSVQYVLKGRKGGRTDETLPAPTPVRDQSPSSRDGRKGGRTDGTEYQILPDLPEDLANERAIAGSNSFLLKSEMVAYVKACRKAEESTDPQEKQLAEYNMVNHGKLIVKLSQNLAKWYGLEKGDKLGGEVLESPYKAMITEDLIALRDRLK